MMRVRELLPHEERESFCPKRITKSGKGRESFCQCSVKYARTWSVGFYSQSIPSKRWERTSLLGRQGVAT